MGVAHETDNRPYSSQMRGVVTALLTRSPSHPHYIKVRLTGRQVGRVQAVVTLGE